MALGISQDELGQGYAEEDPQAQAVPTVYESADPEPVAQAESAPDVQVREPSGPSAPSAGGPSSVAPQGGSGSEGGNDYAPNGSREPEPVSFNPQAYTPMSPIMDIGSQSVAMRAPYEPAPQVSAPVAQYATGGGARLRRRMPETSGGMGLMGNQLGVLGDTRLYGGNEDFESLIPELVRSLSGDF